MEMNTGAPALLMIEYGINPSLRDMKNLAYEDVTICDRSALVVQSRTRWIEGDKRRNVRRAPDHMSHTSQAVSKIRRKKTSAEDEDSEPNDSLGPTEIGTETVWEAGTEFWRGFFSPGRRLGRRQCVGERLSVPREQIEQVTHPPFPLIRAGEQIPSENKVDPKTGFGRVKGKEKSRSLGALDLLRTPGSELR